MVRVRVRVRARDDVRRLGLELVKGDHAVAVVIVLEHQPADLGHVELEAFELLEGLLGFGFGFGFGLGFGFGFG